MLMTLICEEKIYKSLGKNTEIFIKASKDIGLEVNFVKTKYMITSRQQNIVKKILYRKSSVSLGIGWYDLSKRIRI